jgi:hypothetical protein
MIEGVGLGKERPQAVTQQDQRQAGVLRPGDIGELRQVLDNGLRALFAKVAEGPFGRGVAVAAMVVGIEHPAGRHHRLQGLDVAAGVLAHAVGQLQDGPWRNTRRRPTEGGDGGPVRGLEAELSFVDLHSGPPHALSAGVSGIAWGGRGA